MIHTTSKPTCRVRTLSRLICVICVVLSAVVVPFGRSARAAESRTEDVVGRPVALKVQPETIQLAGRGAGLQIVVTGRYGDGTERDLTSSCDLTIEEAGVIGIEPEGYLQAGRNGRTTLVVRVGGLTTRVPVAVTDCDKPTPTSFRRQLMGALNVGGCNQGACHGVPSGRGGFRLSLRGYDPAADFQEMTRGMLGRRTDHIEPEAALIYLKGLGRVPHEGGQRFTSENIGARTMLAWLKEGMPDDPPGLPALQKIEIAPGPSVRIAPARRQQLAVRAHFADGSVRDVTRLTVFSSSDEGIAAVDRNGLVEFRQTGEVAVLCRYLDVIQCVRLTFLEPRKDFRWSNPSEAGYVDQHVFAKLKMLNILPAELSTDLEFLRRVYLDLCGVLPTPEEVRTFLNQVSSVEKESDRLMKRARSIDQLLERPEFADYWAHKWLDLLRCNRLNLQIKGSLVYRDWLRGHIADNTPWNRVVRDLLTADGSTFTNPAANYYRGASDGRNLTAVVRDPQNLAETTAQVFFGVRLQCAQCHNHPYERWTQDDYHHMAAWFVQLKAKPDPLNPGRGPQPYLWQLKEDAVVVYSGRTGEVVQPRTGKVMAPKILGVPAPVIPPGKDRRELLADQVVAPDNPFFARSTVNRVWYHLLGKGIVDPPDDFRDSNPPANEALLDALAADFVAHDFDMKRIIRTIVNSRTYQLSTHPRQGGDSTETVQEDNRYFSRALVKHKRLPAEVLLDAICAATDVPEKFANHPLGTRAIELPDGEVIYTGGRYATWERHPFLKAFGQPNREVACECERESDVNLSRVLEMKNGSFLQQKLQTPNNRIGKLLAQKIPPAEILTELFLATLSRPPLPHESAAALAVVEKAADKRAAWESIHWALLNTNEFLFRH